MPVSDLSQLRQPGKWVPTASWILYDLANTIYAATVVYLLVPRYVDRFESWSIGIAQTASMIVAGLLVPVLGAICDRTRKTSSYLAFGTSLCIVCLAGFGIVFDGPRVWILVLFFVAHVSYQTALVFYNALLPSVARFERSGLVSGLGVGVGYLGTLLILGAFLLISDTSLRFFVGPNALIFGLSKATNLKKQSERQGARGYSHVLRNLGSAPFLRRVHLAVCGAATSGTAHLWRGHDGSLQPCLPRLSRLQ